MSDLVTFLLAQLDADEAAARAALAPSEMHPYGDTNLPVMWADEVPDAVRAYLGGTWGEHFARHDPARVLAEVAAKRAIVDRHAPHWYTTGTEAGDVAGWECTVCGGHFDKPEDVECPDVRALASVYEGAPGWQEEWR